MTILNDENRRTLQKLSDRLSELNQFENQKGKIRNDNTFRLAIEMLFVKAGELMTRFKRDCLNIFESVPVFQKLIGFRGKLAHIDQTDVEKVISAFDVVQNLKHEVERLISQSYSEDDKLQGFELFGGFGTRQERQKYIDALVDKLTNFSNDDLIRFPQGKNIKNLSDTTEIIINHPDLLMLSLQNTEISKEISQDITKWAKGLYSELIKNNPFEKEENLFHHISNLDTTKFSKQLSAIKKELLNIYDGNELNYSFYIKKNRELIDSKKSEKLSEYQHQKIVEQQEILKQSFLRDWENKLTEKRLKYELNFIDSARKKFVESLYKRIQDYLNLKELLSPFTNDFGRLWDLSGGIWNKTGFDVLKKYNELLQNDKSIKELSELLGRYRKAEKDVEEKFYSETIIKNEWKTKHAQKNEFVGIRESDDLNTLLPVETLLLADAETEILFYKKFAEKKLLTFDYENIMSVSENETDETSNEKEENKGPIILCVDTSGSMQGTPEQVAKMLALALLKNAMKDERKCYLISFSTEISTLDLSNLPDSIENLIDFLSMSFKGGTDATPAFEEALNMIEEEDFRKADVLFISDFVMSEIEEELEEKIEVVKKNKTSFHSLQIGSTGNSKAINIFDNNWVYNPNDLESLVKQISKIQ